MAPIARSGSRHDVPVRVLQVVNVAVANVREEVRISQQLEHEGRIGAPHVAQSQVGVSLTVIGHACWCSDRSIAPRYAVATSPLSMKQTPRTRFTSVPGEWIKINSGARPRARLPARRSNRTCRARMVRRSAHSFRV